MEFVEEAKQIHLNSISKSFAEMYDTCKLKAWKKKRTSATDDSRLMQIGKAAHEMFASECAKRNGEVYKVSRVSDPSILVEAKEIVDGINFDRLIGSSQIIDVEMKVDTLLNNGMSLIGIFDLVLLWEDEFLGEYIQIIDFKSGYRVSKELDNEAMFYIYLAAKFFGLPVTFTRISGRSRDEWGQYFSFEKAISFGEYIEDYATEIKKIIESEEEPLPEAGVHCKNCPNLQSCYDKYQIVVNIEDMITKYALASAVAEQLKEDIKKYRMENQEKVVTKHFLVDFKESSFKKIKTKKMKKADFISALVKSGKIKDVLAAVDIKLTDQVVAIGEQMGIEFGEQVKRVVSIDVIKSLEDIPPSSEESNEVEEATDE